MHEYVCVSMFITHGWTCIRSRDRLSCIRRTEGPVAKRTSTQSLLPLAGLAVHALYIKNDTALRSCQLRRCKL